MDSELREELAALREMIAALSKAVATSARPPHREIYTKAEAAELLGGISVKTLDRWIRRREISTCDLGDREGIPRREIERLATPKSAPPRHKAGPKPRAEKSVTDEVADLEARLAAKRKRR